MPFFLPESLVSFDYLTTEKVESNKIAEPYQKDIDFAFFVVNFGYSKSEYDELTPRQRTFIYKAWENKLVSDTTHIRNSMLNALQNALRKKNKKFIKLWRKQSKKADLDIVSENLNTIKEAEKNDGDWVSKILAANGKRQKGGG